jgi:hypothetical protein
MATKSDLRFGNKTVKLTAYCTDIIISSNRVQADPGLLCLQRCCCIHLFLDNLTLLIGV